MGYGGPFGAIWHVLTTVFTVVGGFVLFAALVVVTILLVRFLLVGTRAATLYLEKNAPGAAAAAPQPSAAPSTAPAPAPATKATASATPAKPAARRTPPTPSG